MNTVEYEKLATKELAELPEEFRQSVKQLAWERGHSSGFLEVLGVLSDLIYALREPLAAFEKRIRGEYIGPKKGFHRPAAIN